MKPITFLLTIIALVFVSSVDANQYSKSKASIKNLYRTILTDSDYIYAPCPISKPTCPIFQLDQPYIVKMSIEHIAPAKRIMEFLKCKSRNRKECAKETTKANECLGDPLNLYPSVLTVNRSRGSRVFVEHVSYARNRFIFDFPMSKKFVSPPKRSRGKIARAMFHMHDRGCIKLNPTERNMYKKWDNSYPLTKEESIRNLYFSHFLGFSDKIFMKK